MKAIVLAAGLGSRLLEKTKEYPKSILKVNGKEILSYTLSPLMERNVETIVVTGFGNNLIEDFIQTKFPKIKTVFNKDFTRGSVLSLLCALPQINTDFVLLNADHIYSESYWEVFLNKRKEITGMCDFDRNLTDDDMKVKLDGKKMTAISKTLQDFDAGYIGVTFVPFSKLNIYKKTANEIAKTNDKLAVESILALLIENKQATIEIADASGFKWWEVDNASDLDKAIKEVKI